jgi:hypothetical protein
VKFLFPPALSDFVIAFRFSLVLLRNCYAVNAI